MRFVTLVGHLADVPEIRYLTDGTMMLTVRLGTNELRFVGRDAQGQSQYESDTLWASATFFGSRASALHQMNLAKGDYVLVQGHLFVRTYQRRDGTQGVELEVRQPELKILHRRQGGESGSGADGSDQGARGVGASGSDRAPAASPIPDELAAMERPLPPELRSSADSAVGIDDPGDPDEALLQQASLFRATRPQASRQATRPAGSAGSSPRGSTRSSGSSGMRSGPAGEPPAEVW